MPAPKKIEDVEQPERGDMQSVIDAAQAAVELRPLSTEHGGYGVVAIVPPGAAVQELSSLVNYDPPYVSEHIAVSEPASFLDYFSRFKTTRSVVMCVKPNAFDNEQPGFLGIIDYHDPAGKAGRGSHRVVLNPVYTEQWKFWRSVCNQSSIPQATLVQILEEHYDDVVTPPGAQLQEIVAKFRQTKSVHFRSEPRLSDGQMIYEYVEDIKSEGGAGGSMLVPVMIELAIPVFMGGDKFRVPCFFRHRTHEGKLVFSIAMKLRHEIEDAAFEQMLSAVRAGLDSSVPLYFGTFA